MGKGDVEVYFYFYSGDGRVFCVRDRICVCLYVCMYVCMCVLFGVCVRMFAGRRAGGRDRKCVCWILIFWLSQRDNHLRCTVASVCIARGFHFVFPIFFSLLYLIRASVDGDSALFALLVVLTLFEVAQLCLHCSWF